MPRAPQGARMLLATTLHGVVLLTLVVVVRILVLTAAAEEHSAVSVAVHRFVQPRRASTGGALAPVPPAPPPRVVTIALASSEYGGNNAPRWMRQWPNASTCSHQCAFEKSVERADVVWAASRKSRVTRTRPDQVWVGTFWESPGHYPSLTPAEFDYTASFRQDATIRSQAMMYDTAANLSTHIASTSLVPFEAKKQQAAMMSVWISNCHIDRSGRLKLMRELRDTYNVTVTSYGRCDTSSQIMSNPRMSNDDKLKVKLVEGAKHLFLYAAENDACAYYHTEKVYAALMAGTVPVYVGFTATLDDYIPDHSVIFSDEFSDAGALAEYLHLVASNETMYNEYLAWRSRPLPSRMRSKLEEAARYGSQEWQCDVCRFFHEHGRASEPPLRQLGCEV